MNTTSSHESRAHGDAENTRHDPAKMKLASYHPDLPVIRRSYAKYADAVEKMDNDVRTTIDALKADGLYDDTIIIYNSDHAGVMPRSKRFLYSSGMDACQDRPSRGRPRGVRDMLFGGTPLKRELHNVLDWMDDDAVGLVKEYLQSHPEQAKNILGKIAEDYAIEVAK